MQADTSFEDRLDDGAHEFGPSSIDSEYDEYLALSDHETPNCTLDGPNEPSGGVCDLPTVEEIGLTCLDYGIIHQPPVKFKSPQRSLFIPGQPIEIQITSYERSVTTHILNPNLYTVEVRHGDFQWTLKKRYKQIQHLHQQLRLFRASLNIPFPTRTHRERRSSFKHEANKEKEKKYKSRTLPRFPSKPEALVPFEKIEHRMKQLEEYLQNLLKISIYRNHHETASFLEVSEVSFIGELSPKGKEGLVMKRSRSSHPASTGFNLCGCFDTGFCARCHFVCNDLCGSWRNRWLVAKESFVAYIRPKDGRIKAVMLFDQGFEISSGVFSTGHRNGLHIVNLSRQMVIKCPTRRCAQEWLAHIKESLHREGGDFLQRNRYYSFAPTRVAVKAGWLVDGRQYMEAVADAIAAATQEVFIADWWLSPEIHLKRPVRGDIWRLDKLLLRKAEAGVKIFVLLYKEVEVALGINSYYSKVKLAGLHENIKVLRHPDHAKAGVFFWAHHEKLVVVDQVVAFVGGIDLCYGRWDDYKHRLTDVGDSVGNLTSMFSLTLASNALMASYLSNKDATDGPNGSLVMNEPTSDIVMQPSPDNIKCNTPEMERKTIFSTVRDRSRGLMHMWSFSSADGGAAAEGGNQGEDEGALSSTTPPASPPEVPRDEVDNPDGRVVVANVEDPETDELESKLWLGKDYCNFIVKDFNDLDQPFQDLVDRTVTPRMPWHDVSTVVMGAAARDVARHFIQRWNSAKTEKARLNAGYPYLLPKTYKNIPMDFKIPNVRLHNVACQVVRSVSHWSGGFLDVGYWEGSIHEAYVDVIAKASHYVYIENQFFISLSSLQVKNQVADSIIKRIIRAHREGSVFRVFIVLPLLPGFEGEVGTPSGTALHAITHWNYASICRGRQSLLSRLEQEGVKDPTQYITFHGLRTHSSLSEHPISELIYVHSKLLIADDRVVICGSANINDRSLLGKRDSEMAVIIEDEEFVMGTMNGVTVSCGKFASSLRKHLFREHLGLLEAGPTPCIDVSDPVSDSFFHETWRKIALNNTHIYEKVFHSIPTDEVNSFQALKKYLQEPPLVVRDIDESKELLDTVKGHLVMLPLKFLCDETLTPNSSSVEGMMPTSLWT